MSTKRSAYDHLLAAIAHETYVEERWLAGSRMLRWMCLEHNIRVRAWERYIYSWRGGAWVPPEERVLREPVDC